MFLPCWGSRTGSSSLINKKSSGAAHVHGWAGEWQSKTSASATNRVWPSPSSSSHAPRRHCHCLSGQTGPSHTSMLGSEPRPCFCNNSSCFILGFSVRVCQTSTCKIKRGVSVSISLLLVARVCLCFPLPTPPLFLFKHVLFQGQTYKGFPLTAATTVHHYVRKSSKTICPWGRLYQLR